MPTLIFLGFFLFFLFFQSTSFYGGDAGDLVTAAITGSTAHPPGYPLYSLLGYILSFIPISTPAWRVGLLSSLAAAGTLTVVYYIIVKITKDKLPSIIAAATLGSTYLFWLYGIVPEVFALNALLMSLLLYISFWFSEEPTVKKLYGIAVLIGLGLAHHHIIVFSLPAVFYFLWQQRKFAQHTTWKQKGTMIGFLFLGILPYSWAIIAGLRTAPLTWSDPVTVENFLRLVSRADYGSFQSGTTFGQNIQTRLLQWPAMFDLYVQDFTYFGLALFLIGIVSMFRKARTACLGFILGFVFTGPLYFFYASYLFTTAFHIATAERFLIPSYVFIIVFIGYGMHAILEAARKRSKVVQWIVMLMIVLLPLSLLYTNYPKLSILKYDQTGEQFGRDLLDSIEPDGIFMVQGDHPVFNTQYVHYAEGYRPDVSCYSPYEAS